MCALPVVGLSVMFLYDWVDVFLYSGKIFTHLKKQHLADAYLVIFAVLYFYLRLYGVLHIIYHV